MLELQEDTMQEDLPHKRFRLQDYGGLQSIRMQRNFAGPAMSARGQESHHEEMRCR